MWQHSKDTSLNISNTATKDCTITRLFDFQALFVNGKEEQLMSKVSVPPVLTNLLIGQNSDKNMTGQVDEVQSNYYELFKICLEFSFSVQDPVS